MINNKNNNNNNNNSSNNNNNKILFTFTCKRRVKEGECTE